MQAVIDDQAVDGDVPGAPSADESERAPVPGADRAPVSPTGHADRPPAPTARAKRLGLLALVLLLVIGFVVRVHRLDDSPLKFHPTRQLHTALLAKSIYLDRVRPADDPERIAAGKVADHEQHIEAPITEDVLATLYQVIGRESLWAAGVYEIGVWLVGAVLLYLLLGHLTTTLGQVVGAAVHLLIPLAVVGGRSLQPDPLMVTLVVATLLLLLQHDEHPHAARIAAAGATAGLALLLKPTSAPLVLFSYVLLSVHRAGWRGLFSRSSAIFGGCFVLPSAIAVATGYAPANTDLSSNYFVASLLTDTEFYQAWKHLLEVHVGLALVGLAFVGTFLSRGRARALLAALWLAYLSLGVAFDYRMVTHSYYHLVLVPIVAIGCAIAVVELADLLRRRDFRVASIALAVLVVASGVALVRQAWQTPQPFIGRTQQIAAARAVAKVTGPGARVVSITGTYGRDLGYYGPVVVVAEVPNAADRELLHLQGEPAPTPAKFLIDAHERLKVRWLAITAPRALLGDPALLEELADHYPVVDHGPGWLVLDLSRRRP